MNWAQITLLILVILSFFVQAYRALNGREAQEPTGEGGLALAIVILAADLLLYYYAGLFSTH